MFYKGKIPLFSEKCGFQPSFYRKSVFLISVGIAYLPIYYIMCIGQKSNTTTEVASIVLLSIQLPA